MLRNNSQYRDRHDRRSNAWFDERRPARSYRRPSIQVIVVSGRASPNSNQLRADTRFVEGPLRADDLMRTLEDVTT
jgi:hypothetical protein